MLDQVPQVYILCQTPAHVQPLAVWLKRKKVPYKLWNLSAGMLNLQETPPEGIFLNYFKFVQKSDPQQRHLATVEFAQQVVKWLEDNNRLVVSGSNTFNFSISRIKQYLALRQKAISVPKTLAISNKNDLKAAVIKFNTFPLIVRNDQPNEPETWLFSDLQEVEAFLLSADFKQLAANEVILLQHYIEPRNGIVYHSVFIDRQFVYTNAIAWRTQWQQPPAQRMQTANRHHRWHTSEKLIDSLSQRQQFSYETFLNYNQLDNASINWFEDEKKQRFVYYVDLNTDFDQTVEKRFGIHANEYLAEFLRLLLWRYYKTAVADQEFIS
jgi:hypothetical protein